MAAVVHCKAATWYELALDIRWLADRIVKWIRNRR
jgi:hypothetical protein